MGLGINSGQVSILNAVLTPAVPALSATQTFINITGTGNGAVQNTYTVTAGKTFYLFGLCGNAGAANSYVYKNDGTTLIAQVNGIATSASPSIVSGVPIGVYTATQVVKVNTTNAIPYMLWGVEQ